MLIIKLDIKKNCNHSTYFLQPCFLFLMSTSFVVAVFFPPAQFRELHLVYSQGEPRLFALDRIIFYILVLLFDRVTF